MAGMARHCVFLVPGDAQARTGGTLYDRRIAEGLRALGWQVDWCSPGDGFPSPGAPARAQAAACTAALPDGALVVADGLAFGVLAELAERHAQRLRWVALVHHPLALESGLSPQEQDRLQASERRALACARQVIVTSAATARALGAYGVPATRTAVVEPGTDPVPPAQGSGQGLSLLCVATVTPRKAHALLLQALAGLRERPWHLHCVGSLDRDAATAAAAQDLVQALGLGQRVTWHGEVAAEPLQALYAQADLFVLPSLYEGYGMAFAEALAHGLPVLGCAAGAVPDTVPATAGVLVPPGDPVALQAALQPLLDNTAWRQALAAGARAAGQRLPRWEQAAARFAAVLEASA
ncbi:glycosyltransferase family 4 protein [Pseudorhodoferax soli]|uniref:Glycosyltransferase involved in cell wall biosynthesis n=1 Tax=Pseudorhodoferax soli TaxID=545864 RepID=A0A368XMU3_9BURK|nr:glycosyltransferase family 4 protein [Pseudorhodoferax soli]RCW69321.1 glycosyltransferase involved in cell wall biosynthesis [Pseudorhodoferax soli]